MYGLDYYEKMLLLYSETGRRISNIRWDFVSEVRPKIVLDYGAGLGWFRAMRPVGIEVDSFDLPEFPVKHTGILHDKYDLVCMWDVLEHVLNFSELDKIFNMTDYVALTYPIKPDGVDIYEWKHFKPLEHIHYLNEDTLTALFRKMGFDTIKHEMPECPPREDVHSFLFKRGESIG